MLINPSVYKFSNKYYDLEGYVKEEVLYKTVSTPSISLDEISFLARLRMYTYLWRTLGFLHNNSIVHRDLHNMNLMYNVEPKMENEAILRTKIIDYELMLK